MKSRDGSVIDTYHDKYKCILLKLSEKKLDSQLTVCWIISALVFICKLIILVILKHFSVIAGYCDVSTCLVVVYVWIYCTCLLLLLLMYLVCR